MARSLQPFGLVYFLTLGTVFSPPTFTTTRVFVKVAPNETPQQRGRGVWLTPCFGELPVLKLSLSIAMLLSVRTRPPKELDPHPILAEATTGSGGVLIRDTKSEMVSSLCQTGRALLRADPQESQRDTHNTVAQIKGNQGISPS